MSGSKAQYVTPITILGDRFHGASRHVKESVNAVTDAPGYSVLTDDPSYEYAFEFRGYCHAIPRK